MQGTDRTQPDRCQLTPKKACNENQQDHHGRRPGRRRGDGAGAKAGPVFQVNEFKGWAVVDGRAEDAGKLGAAQTQMGIYRYLLSDLIWAPSLRHCIEDR